MTIFEPEKYDDRWIHLFRSKYEDDNHPFLSNTPYIDDVYVSEIDLEKTKFVVEFFE